MKPFFCVFLLLTVHVFTFAQQNPDQITVFFPGFKGPEQLGHNVSKVLSLQLAQTTRKHPWPNNPEQLDFGDGVIKWSQDAYGKSQASQALKTAQTQNLLAQLVVVGNTQRFGQDILVEVDVLIPKYQSAHKGCDLAATTRCDFRQKNLELWPVSCGTTRFFTPLPRRRYAMAGIVLSPEVVEQFAEVKGLPIMDGIDSSEILGRTGTDLRFIEFNRHLPNAPTKLRSNQIEGYVALPSITRQQSEFADMAGGILQLFRGDWQAANNSFSRVISNKMTRIPLKVDAYLLRGMVQFRHAKDGLNDILKAVEMAPYDAGAARYYIAALLAKQSPTHVIQQAINDKTFLFDKEDDWLNQAKAVLACQA